MADTNWKAMDSGVMDWLDNKRAKTLRVSNDRESFQLKRIRRSLETMKSMNDNLMKQEERKVKRWLAKQAELSPSSSYKNLYKIPSSEVNQEANQEVQQVSERGSAETPWSQFGDHLPNFVSFLRLPTKRPGCVSTYEYNTKRCRSLFETCHSNPIKELLVYCSPSLKPILSEGLILQDDQKHSKDFTPFSGTNLSMQTVFARTSHGSRGSFYNPHPTDSVSKKDISARQLYADNNSFSMQEAISMFPSLQKLSVTGENFSFSKLHLHETASGSPASERRLKCMLERAQEEEKVKQTVTLPQIRPEEFLSCRYLRLSQSNINTLLQLCKESGVHIDIHPHMKESEIDINTVLSSNLSRAV